MSEREVIDCIKKKTNLVDLESEIQAKVFEVYISQYELRSAVWRKSTKRKGGRMQVQKCIFTAFSDPEMTFDTIIHVFDDVFSYKIPLSCRNILKKIIFDEIEEPYAVAGVRKRLEEFQYSQALANDTLEGQIRQLFNQNYNLEAKFQAIDLDHSGLISASEFLTFLQSCEINLPIPLLEQLIDRFDLDGDHQLSYQEFLNFIKPHRYGFQILTPFGMFYEAAEPDTTMKTFRERIQKRIFWLQHNTSRDLGHKQQKMVFSRQFGTVDVKNYEPQDPVGRYFFNHELILVLYPNRHEKPKHPTHRFRYQVQYDNRTRPENLRLKQITFLSAVEKSKSKSLSIRDQKRSAEVSSTLSIDLEVDIEDWTVEHVAFWLKRKIDLPQYLSKFASIDGTLIVQIEESDLKSRFGIKSITHRRKIMSFLTEMKRKSAMERLMKETLVIDLYGTPIEEFMALPSAQIVKSILSEAQLLQYMSHLLDAKIHGGNIFQVDKAWLSECGIESKKHRSKIQSTIEKLRLHFFKPETVDDPFQNMSRVGDECTAIDVVIDEPPAAPDDDDEAPGYETTEPVAPADPNNDEALDYEMSEPVELHTAPDDKAPGYETTEPVGDDEPLEPVESHTAPGDDEDGFTHETNDEISIPSVDQHIERHQGAINLSCSGAMIDVVASLRVAFTELADEIRHQSKQDDLSLPECMEIAFTLFQKESQTTKSLTRREFERGLNEILHVQVPWVDFGTLFDLIDTNHDGKIQQNEFVQLIRSETSSSAIDHLTRNILEQLSRSSKSALEFFSRYDKEKTLILQLHQVCKLLNEIGLKDKLNPLQLDEHFHKTVGRKLIGNVMSLSDYANWIQTMFDQYLNIIASEHRSALQETKQRVCAGMNQISKKSNAKKQEIALQKRIDVLSQDLQQVSMIYTSVVKGISSTDSQLKEHHRNLRKMARKTGRDQISKSKTSILLSSFANQLRADILNKIDDTLSQVEKRLQNST